MIALGILTTWLTLTAAGFAGLSALGRVGAREDARDEPRRRSEHSDAGVRRRADPDPEGAAAMSPIVSPRSPRALPRPALRCWTGSGEPREPLADRTALDTERAAQAGTADRHRGGASRRRAPAPGAARRRGRAAARDRCARSSARRCRRAPRSARRTMSPRCWSAPRQPHGDPRRRSRRRRRGVADAPARPPPPALPVLRREPMPASAGGRG